MNADASHAHSSPPHNANTLAERLARYVAVKSPSRGEHALAAMIRRELEAEGLVVDVEGANLWTQIGDRPRPRLLLNSHLDTVPPGENWTRDPWTPSLENGRLYGLGANDAKGCVVALVEAFLTLKRELEAGRLLGGTVVLALTAEEEISGQGLGAVLPKLSPLDAAVVGEPTGLTPMSAQRGLLVLKVEAAGRTAHPGNTPPAHAQNAVVTAAEDVLRLAAFDWGPTHPLLGAPYGQATVIEGGVARNVIPDRCTFWLDVRTTPLESHASVVDRLRRHLRSRVHVHSDRLIPIETSADELIVQAACRAAGLPAPSGSPTMSDMAFLRNIPAAKFGPGQSARSHTADEYVDVSELERGMRCYLKLVREFTGHYPPS